MITLRALGKCANSASNGVCVFLHKHLQNSGAAESPWPVRPPQSVPRGSRTGVGLAQELQWYCGVQMLRMLRVHACDADAIFWAHKWCARMCMWPLHAHAYAASGIGWKVCQCSLTCCSRNNLCSSDLRCYLQYFCDPEEHRCKFNSATNGLSDFRLTNLDD